MFTAYCVFLKYKIQSTKKNDNRVLSTVYYYISVCKLAMNLIILPKTQKSKIPPIKFYCIFSPW